VVAQSAVLDSDVVAVDKELGEGKDLVVFLRFLSRPSL
jgi:hypothetical protein